MSSVSDPRTLIGFKTLETNLIVNGPIGSADPGDISLKAGEKITLLPGFQAKAGSHFYAFIDDHFDCDANGFYKSTVVNNEIENHETNTLLAEAYQQMADSITAEREKQMWLLEHSPDYISSYRDLGHDKSINDAMTLSPSPAESYFTIGTQEVVSLYATKIYDSQGKILLERKNVQTGEHIDISHLTNGSYHVYIQYTNVEGKTLFKTFVLIKI